MNKFEQLIEFVINDEEQKARELFHDIVVEKSRAIYESLMNEEADEEIEEAAEEEGEEEELDESFGEPMADSADNLVNSTMMDNLDDDVEMDEVSMAEADEEGEEEAEIGSEEEAEFGGEEEGSEGLEDRVVDLEDKLDELMAEFEAMMGGEESDSMGGEEEFAADAGGDAMATDDTAEIMPMAEALELKAAPKPVTSEEGGVNKKSTVAANAGAKGPVGNTVKPVSTGTSMGGRHDAAGAYSNTVKDLGATPTQEAGKKAFKTAAPAPVKTQASGVNTKSPVARG
jgi:hypothetical protein